MAEPGDRYFDDAAFFFVCMSALLTVLVPWTGMKLSALVWPNKQEVSGVCECATCQKKFKLVEASKTSFKARMTTKNIVFVVMYILLFICIAQSSKFHEHEVPDFDPYEVLGVDSMSTASQIKKAYKALTMIWHPDINPAEDAKETFMRITEANKILTDPDALRNWQVYGSADGKQQATVSASIGLPSFLTDPENVIPVLIMYFLLFVVAPCVSIFIWWQRSSKFHKSGLQNDTLKVISKQLQPTHNAVNMIEQAASAVEWAQFERTKEKDAAVKELEAKVSEKWFKPMLKYAYVRSPRALLNAYLQGVTIPAILQPDLKVLLQDIFPVLEFILALSKARTLINQMFAILKLMQCVTQGLWVDAVALDQLGCLSPEDIKKAYAHKIYCPSDLLYLPEGKRKELFPELTEDEHVQIMHVAKAFPRVEVSHEILVANENEMFLRDIAELAVTLKRNTVLPEVSEEKLTAAKKAILDRLKQPEMLDVKKDHVSEEDLKADFEDRLESMGTGSDQHKEKDPSGAYVHSENYPFLKRETWYVTVIHRIDRKRARLVGFQKTENLATEDTLTFKFPLLQPGRVRLEIHAICDSYLGCSKMIPFNIQVGTAEDAKTTMETRALELKASASEAALDDDKNTGIDMDNPFNLSPFWANFWDGIFMCALFFGAYKYAESYGYTQKFVDPVVRRFQILIEPLMPTIGPVVYPIADFIGGIVQYLGNMLHRDEGEYFNNDEL
jgi:translocation protein SEC63